MKKIILLFLFTTSCNTLYSQSSWFWQQPYPTGNKFNCVKLIDAQTGYAAGVLGTIVKTTNGGLNWVVQPTNTQTTFNNIDFIDANTGVAVGDSGIIVRTSNGGINWSKQNLASATTILRGIDFVNNTQIGYIAPYNSSIYKTTNSGITWTQLNTGFINPNISVSFIDSLNGMVGGTAIVIKTTNGGLNWTSVLPGLGGFDFVNSLSYFDPLNAIILIEGDRIHRTTDGGINWSSYTIDLSSASECCDIARYLSFANVNTGFVVSDFGTIAKSTNGGMNWSYNTIYTRYDSRIGLFWGLNTLDTNNALAVGSGGKILRTNDGGLNWNIQNGYNKSLYGNYFTSANTGYSVGDSGKILKTTNGGDNWNLTESGTVKKLNSIFFANENTGYVAGDTGTILKTTNSGNKWEIQSTGLTGVKRNINDIYFLNANTGIAAVDSGKVLKTVNGGINWLSFILGVEIRIKSICMLTSEIVLACSIDGIYKSSNGGENWITVASGINGRGNKIRFSDSMNGISIGTTNESHKSTDGGNSWFRVFLPGQGIPLHSVCILKSNQVFACGTDGVIIKSTNGGLNWTKLQNLTLNYLYSIFFVDENTGYIAGEYGTLLKTTNGGMTFLTNLNSNIPEDFALSQNYPNPFNPTTKINYKIKSLGLIKLILYSLSGKEILKLVNENQTPGEYEIVLDASTLPSGVYFYSLYSNNKILNTKKCILIK